MQFDQPPLLELIAQVKWLTAPTGQAQPTIPLTIPQPIFPTSLQEEFFSSFSKESAASGWTASERMFPSGYPLLSYQPVLRIRSFRDTESHMIYQVGPGVFSAHAMPPYKNWESFRPFAERGLEYLLKVRPPDERDKHFFGVTLRYLDLFTPKLIGDITVGKFLTEILGFSLTIPSVLGAQIRPGVTAEPQLTLSVPLASGLEMQLSVAGNATVGDRKGILMDTAVSTQGVVASNADSVFAVWEEAHNAIRKTFIGLTTKLHSAMGPIEGSQ
jgi:uncharacterized protein (TIGR04255 family)